MFGMAWTKASLTAQLMNGVCVFVLVCEQGWTLRALGVTLSVCLFVQLCDMSHETFYVVLNMIWFLRLASVIRGKFELLNFPRYSVATRLRCGVIFNYHCAANLPLSISVKQFWKSVTNDRVTAISLVSSFFGTQCSLFLLCPCVQPASVDGF